MRELDDLMDLAEGLISFVVKRCLERRRVGLAGDWPRHFQTRKD